MPRKEFEAFTRLDASDVNTYLMDQSVMSFAGTAARGSAIATPVEGMLTYLEDSARYDTYNGSSHVPMDGLTLVKAQTIGSAVSSIVVSDVFSSDYDNYRILLNTNTGSGTNLSGSLQLGSTTTGYFGARALVTFGATQTLLGTNNLSAFSIGNLSTVGGSYSFDVITPFLATRTSIQGNNVYRLNSTSGYMTTAAGFQNSDTSFTEFTFSVGANTITGGSIEVYGYKKA